MAKITATEGAQMILAAHISSLVAKFEQYVHHFTVRGPEFTTVDDAEFSRCCTCMTPHWVRETCGALASVIGGEPDPFFDFLAESGYFRKGSDYLNKKLRELYSEHDKIEQNDRYCLFLSQLVEQFKLFLEQRHFRR